MSIDLLYGYYVNLDERGCFYADVRDCKGETVFEVKAGYDLLDSEFDFETYWMKNKNDIKGLEKLLKDIGAIKKTGMLLSSYEFEQRLEESPQQQNEYDYEE